MRTLRTMILFAIAASLASCATTHIVSTWREPGATAVSFRKVLVISPSRDESLRRTSEDELAQRLPSVEAVPSYTLLGPDQIQNRELVKQVVRDHGFDGVVVFRIVKAEKQATWVPGAYVGPAYAYGGWGYYDPGYVEINTVVRVETNVYSVADDKMVWAAASDTMDPSSIKSLVKDVAKEVGKEMKKQGFLR
jgi:hypothetical protein